MLRVQMVESHARSVWPTAMSNKHNAETPNKRDIFVPNVQSQSYISRLMKLDSSGSNRQTNRGLRAV